MKPNEFLREILIPLTSPPVVLAMLLFFVLFQVVMLATIFGQVIAFVLAAQLVVFVLPAMLRYLMVVLEARAFGREPAALDIDLFPWVGNIWTLFPILHVAAVVYLFFVTQSYFGQQAAVGAALLYVFFLPASLVTLAMTHSALASLNPVTIFKLIQRRGFAYLIGPMFALLATWLVVRIDKAFDADTLTQLACFYFIFAAFALFGGMVRSLKPEREIDIPMPAGIDEEREQELHLVNRTAVLNHAYGIISRGNRSKGLDHILDALADDPDEDAGWAWFFDQMLRWENPEAGLAFAQLYVHELLRYGENVKAVKLMMRCRLINPAFRPLPDDIELARHAAEVCHNDELANFLR
ncbi:MAG: hypothetical protein ACR2QS_07260 [Woeseiaceae bacterium]